MSSNSWRTERVISTSTRPTAIASTTAVTASGDRPGAKAGGSAAARPSSTTAAMLSAGATMAPATRQAMRMVQGSFSYRSIALRM